MRARLYAAFASVTLLALGCGPTSQPDRGGKTAEVAPAPAQNPEARAQAAADAAKVDFAAMVDRLSEPDAHFFSDNYVSNETSYLQVAPALSRAARPGGVYLGVGPEQNFSYIAMTRPKMAFIVDIRRENLILHLLYKSIFQEATSRSHFLALLVGRPHEATSDPGARASISEVIQHAERLPADEATFVQTHARLKERIEKDFGIALDARDTRTLEVTHRAFLKKQLDLQFELLEKSWRKYPKLRELLSQTDSEGKSAGFLASEEPFRLVQRMQHEHRIVPVVGDFAGARAMPGIAAWVREQGLEVSVFYVSNVEQYLFDPGVWKKWSRNIEALPVHEDSLFVRCWLDQGKKHPRQLAGHRTATTLHSMAAFNERQQKKPYASFWSVATEAIVDAPSGGSASPADRTAARP